MSSAATGHAERPPWTELVSTPWPPTARSLCLDTATGQRVWGMNLMEKFGGRVPTWGISESPLVDGDRVIVTPGGPGASVVALEKTKGDAALEIAKRSGRLLFADAL